MYTCNTASNHLNRLQCNADQIGLCDIILHLEPDLLQTLPPCHRSTTHIPALKHRESLRTVRHQWFSFGVDLNVAVRTRHLNDSRSDVIGILI